MVDVRRFWWSTTLLAMAAGCTDDAPPADTPPLPTVTSPANRAPFMDPPTGASVPAAKENDKAKPDGAPSKPEGSKDEGPALNPPDTAPAPKDQPKGDASKAAPAKEALSADEIEEINKLPADERALALKQVICPSSGEHLGAMGVPLKVTAEGQTIFVCCKSCVKEVQANPKEMLDKLKAK
jgi:hypothetical protein